MSILGFQLAEWQAAIVVALLAAAIVAGVVHWVIVARVSRLRNHSDVTDRLLPFGFGGWHIGVLRRAWYPNEALGVRRWVLLTYAIGMGALLTAGGLLIAWVIF